MEIELSSGAPADLHPMIGAKRGLVIVPDVLGRRPLFDQLAARLSAAHTWNVIVVDPYRGRSVAALAPAERDAVVAALDDDETVGDLVEAAGRLEVEPVALAGFGLGGTYAFKAAASHRFDRVVSFHGPLHLPPRWQGPGQREPARLIDHAADPAHILAVVAGVDPDVSRGDIETLTAKGVVVAHYPMAEPGFVHDPSLPAHRPADASDAWARFHRHLTG